MNGEITEHQRRVIAGLQARLGTFSPEEVVAEFEGKASRATVWCVLNRLLKSDVIRKVTLNGAEVLVLTGDDKR